MYTVLKPVCFIWRDEYCLQQMRQEAAEDATCRSHGWGSWRGTWAHFSYL